MAEKRAACHVLLNGLKWPRLSEDIQGPACVYRVCFPHLLNSYCVS